jgi:hypothetical protein
MRCAICGSPDPDIDDGRCMDCISAGISAREQAFVREQCDKCGQFKHTVAVPVPPDTYERLCGECVGQMLGEAYALMRQVVEKQKAECDHPNQGHVHP